jgi:hypothetical protein
MTLKTWQLAAVFCNSAAIAIALVFGLVQLWDDLTVWQLVLPIHNLLACPTACILVFYARKRLIFFMALALPTIHLFACVAEVWRCPPVWLIIKLGGAWGVLFGVTLMRKLAARLKALGDNKKVAVTPLQAIIWLVLMLNIGVNFGVDSTLTRYVEVVLWLVCVLNVWWHFAQYSQHLNLTFNATISLRERTRSLASIGSLTKKRNSLSKVASIRSFKEKINSYSERSGSKSTLVHRSSNPHDLARAKEAEKTKNKLKKNLLVGLLVSVNFLTPYFILIGPLSTRDYEHTMGNCPLRDKDDMNVYTKVATLVTLVGILAVHSAWWHTIIIFRAAHKKKQAREEGSTVNNSAVTSVALKSGSESPDPEARFVASLKDSSTSSIQKISGPPHSVT